MVFILNSLIRLAQLDTHPWQQFVVRFVDAPHQADHEQPLTHIILPIYFISSHSFIRFHFAHLIRWAHPIISCLSAISHLPKPCKQWNALNHSYLASFEVRSMTVFHYIAPLSFTNEYTFQCVIVLLCKIFFSASKWFVEFVSLYWGRCFVLIEFRHLHWLKLLLCIT